MLLVPSSFLNEITFIQALQELCRTKLSKVTVVRPRAKCAWKATLRRPACAAAPKPLYWCLGGCTAAAVVDQRRGKSSIEFVSAWVGWIHSRLQRRTTIRKEFLMSHIAAWIRNGHGRYDVTLQKLIAWLTPALIGSQPLLIIANPFLTRCCLIVIDCMQLHKTLLGYDVILARGSRHHDAWYALGILIGGCNLFYRRELWASKSAGAN